jgi:hypothetical protein
MASTSQGREPMEDSIMEDAEMEDNEDDAIREAIELARDAVREAAKHGLDAVEKAVKEGKKAVKAAHRDTKPIYHDDRLGDLIDDPWTVPRLIELALPTDPTVERDIPGLTGDLGPFPYRDVIDEKELKLVRKAVTEFINLLQAKAEVCSHQTCLMPSW